MNGEHPYVIHLPMPEEIFVSVHLNSNRPVQIITFLQAIENTATYPQCVEVIINIDKGDEAMLRVLEAQKNALRVRVRWIETDLIKSFADTWKPYNLILPLTDPNAYYIILLSDEMLFEEPGWDEQLQQYVGYFPDHIFRLRASCYRWRNYSDPWEGGYAPDSICFTTRAWLMIQGDWNPCNGPDSFQQCVSYYLSTANPFSQTQYHRDLVLPFMRFSGEGVSVGMSDEALQRRIAISTRMWFTLVSHRYQQEARKRAMLLKAHITGHRLQAEHANLALISHDEKRRRIVLRAGDKVETFSYALSWFRVTARNLLRAPLYHYYGGGGVEGWKADRWLGMHFVLCAYWKGYPILRKRTNACILGYYRWRNTKFNHLKGHMQRFPRLYALARKIRRLN